MTKFLKQLLWIPIIIFAATGIMSWIIAIKTFFIYVQIGNPFEGAMIGLPLYMLGIIAVGFAFGFFNILRESNQ